ncbi:MAG: peptide chain release factor N(5)-glutamine methyltransferase [Gammaproteobacteria bacterium]
MNTPNTYQAYLKQLEAGLCLLPDKPEETAVSSLHALWQLAAGRPMSVQRANETPLPELTPAAHQLLAELIQQRLAGRPLAHLTRRQQFMQLEFIVGPEALVPRKETELLARTAQALLDDILQRQDSARVIDVCTGAGNIALSLAHYHAHCHVAAADLSADAIRLAEQNRDHLQLQERVDFQVGDLLAPFANDQFFGKIDLLTCNPPYISSGKLDKMPEEIAGHEPQLAFDGGPFGLNIVGRLLKVAPQYLKSNGWVVFEVGLGQGEPLQNRLSRNPDYQQINTYRDNEDHIRVLALQV